MTKDLIEECAKAKLKPCPFCGNVPKFNAHVPDAPEPLMRIRCIGPCAVRPCTEFYRAERLKRTIELWNRRVFEPVRIVERRGGKGNSDTERFRYFWKEIYGAYPGSMKVLRARFDNAMTAEKKAKRKGGRP